MCHIVYVCLYSTALRDQTFPVTSMGVFSNNSADCGPNVASSPRYVTLSAFPAGLQATSGALLPVPVQVALLDYYNQVCHVSVRMVFEVLCLTGSVLLRFAPRCAQTTIDSLSSISIEAVAGNGAALGGTIGATFNRGRAVFANLTAFSLLLKPRLTATIQVRAFISSQGLIFSPPQSIVMRACGPGIVHVS